MRNVFAIEHEVVRGDVVVDSQVVCYLTPKGRKNWSKGIRLSECIELDLSNAEVDDFLRDESSWKDTLGPEFVENVMALSC